MMANKQIYLVFLVVLLSAVPVLAQTDTGFDCFETIECIDLFDENYYCNELTMTCFLSDEVDQTLIEDFAEPNLFPEPELYEDLSLTQNVTTQSRLTNPTLNLTDLQNQITQLETKTNSLEEKSSSLEFSLQNEINNLQQQVQTIQGKVDALNEQVLANREELDGKVNSISTGLAGLQEELTTTNNELEEVSRNVANQESYTKLLQYLFLVILAILVGMILFHYITNRTGAKTNQELLNYISLAVKKGKKLPQIKAHLQQGGWNEAEVEKAYKKATTKNYKNYLKGKKKEPSSTPNHFDKKKVIFISLISLLIIVGVILILRGATGKAYADFSCSSHLDCASGLLCVDSSCKKLSGAFPKKDCQTTCKVKSVSLTTSFDNQVKQDFKLAPGSGSYTAAGGLVWKIITPPHYCSDSPAIIPIKLVSKIQGQVVGEEIITIAEKETSPEIKHQMFDTRGFRISIDDVEEVCD